MDPNWGETMKSAPMVLIAWLLLCMSACTGARAKNYSEGNLPSAQTLIDAGGTVVLKPGIYACPTHIPSGVYVYGMGGQQIPSTTLANAPNLVVGNPPPNSPVVFACPRGLQLANVWGITIENVVFDFGHGSNGMVIGATAFFNTFKGVTLQNVQGGTALAFKGGVGTLAEAPSANVNRVHDLNIFNARTGISFDGVPGQSVAANNLFDGMIFMNGIEYRGIDIQGDTNSFMGQVQILGLGDNGQAIVFGSEDAGDCRFEKVVVDSIGGQHNPAFPIIQINSSGNSVHGLSIGGGFGPEVPRVSAATGVHYRVEFDMDYGQPDNANKVLSQ
jgi:hypothetical protein